MHVFSWEQQFIKIVEDYNLIIITLFFNLLI